MEEEIEGGVTFDNDGDVFIDQLVQNVYVQSEKTECQLGELEQKIKEGYDASLSNKPEVVDALKRYVPLDASLVPLQDNEEEKKLRKPLHEKYVLPFLIDDEHQDALLLLLGGPGAGKTTYAHQLCQLCWSGLLFNKPIINRIPILIDCKSIPENIDSRKVVSHVLKTQYRLEKSEIRLLKKMPVVFIFEGYSELRNLRFDIYDAFNLSQWNAKTLVTCGLLFYVISLENFRYFFTRRQNFSLLEVYLSPLSDLGVESYITKMYENSEEMLASIKKSHDLMGLINNPLLLSMVVNALPMLLKSNDSKKRFKNKHPRITYVKNFTHTDIYYAFIKSWIDCVYKNFPRKFLNEMQFSYSDINAANLQDGFLHFCENMALEMVKQKRLKLLLTKKRCYKELYDEESNGDSSESQKFRRLEELWEKFITIESPQLIYDMLRCPVQCEKLNKESVLSFSHRSFFDFFMASRINRELFSDDVIKQSREDFLRTLPTLIINKVNFVNTKGIVIFLVQMIKGNKAKIDRLLNILKASRNEEYGEEVSIASANAVTILNVGSFNFSHLNLKGIKVTVSDMRGAYCENTDFEGSDFSQAQLSQIYLKNANMHRTKLTNLKLDASLWFEEDSELQDFDYHPSVNRMALACVNKIYVYETKSKKLIRKINVMKEKILNIRLSSNGFRIAAGCSNGLLLVWDVNTGNEIYNLRSSGHELIAPAVDLSKNGQYILMTTGVIACLIDTYSNVTDLNGNKYFSGFNCTRHMGLITSCSFSKDKFQFVIGSTNNMLEIWDIDKTSVKSLDGHEQSVTCVSFSGDGKNVASGSKDCTVQVWDLSAMRSVVLKGHEAPVTSVSLDWYGRTVVSGSEDCTVRVWDIANKTARVIYRHEHQIRRVCLSGDGLRVASLGKGETQVRVWNIISQEKAQLFSYLLKERGVNFGEKSCLNSSLCVSGADFTQVSGLSDEHHRIIKSRGANITGVRLLGLSMSFSQNSNLNYFPLIVLKLYLFLVWVFKLPHFSIVRSLPYNRQEMEDDQKNEGAQQLLKARKQSGSPIFQDDNNNNNNGSDQEYHSKNNGHD